MYITSKLPLTYHYVIRQMINDESYKNLNKLTRKQIQEIAMWFCREHNPDTDTCTDHLVDNSFARLIAGFLEDPIRYAEILAEQIASDIVFTHKSDLEDIFEEAKKFKKSSRISLEKSFKFINKKIDILNSFNFDSNLSEGD